MTAHIEVMRTEHYTTQVRAMVITIPYHELPAAKAAGLHPAIYQSQHELADLNIAEAKDSMGLMMHTLTSMFRQIGEGILASTPVATINDKFGLLPSPVKAELKDIVPKMTDEQMRAVRDQIVQAPTQKAPTLEVKETPRVKGKRKRSTAARRMK